ncbi:response regulator [Plantactinospora sp. CA-290183]|uniref:response regulator n=1 Tax=Plantactinospora sp. CA-290183 TaxID=3240006 RepID=UPI003D8DECF7
MIRGLLVDDQPLIRSGFRALLDIGDDIEVVAEAADGSEALALAEEHLPDIALIDIQMPVIDGIEATRRIAADPTLARVHVVILTNGVGTLMIFRKAVPVLLPPTAALLPAHPDRTSRPSERGDRSPRGVHHLIASAR